MWLRMARGGARMGRRAPTSHASGLVALGVALFVVLLCWSAPGAEATRATWTDDTSKILYFIDRFAFKEDGKFNIQIDPRQKGVPLRLLICKDDQYDDMIDGYSNSDGRDVCNKIAQNRSKCAYSSFSGFFNITGITRSRDMYWFVLVNCNQTKLDLEFYEYFINPDDEYLGWDNLPLPYMYGILIIVYVVLLAAWLLNICMIDMGAGSNRLHKYLTLWPIMKLFLVIFNTAYWAYISNEGVMHWSMIVVYVIYNALWYAYMFGGLLLISLAWGISRTEVTWIEGIIFAGLQVVFYITWVINLALEGYYVIVSVLGFGVMLVALYFFNTYSLKAVDTALQQSKARNSTSSQLVNDEDPAPQSQPPAAMPAQRSDLRYQRSKLTLEERQRVLGNFMWIHLCYIIPIIAWTLLYAGLFHYENWAYRTLIEATEICLVVALGWLLRLRRRNIYFEFNDDALVDWENASTARSTDVESEGHIEMDAIPHHSPSVETLHNPDESHISSDDDTMPPVYPIPKERGAW